MSEKITVRGFVATEWRRSTTDTGDAVASCRVASTERKLDRATMTWRDGATNWFTVSVFRALARNAAFCVVKGQPVVVTGKLHIRDWERDGRHGTSVEIEAETIGHDLFWGTSSFERARNPVVPVTPVPDGAQDATSGVGRTSNLSDSADIGPDVAEYSGVNLQTGELPAEPISKAAVFTGGADEGEDQAGADDLGIDRNDADDDGQEGEDEQLIAGPSLVVGL